MARDQERYTSMHRWGRANHCSAGVPDNMTLRCDNGTSCTGVAWKRCRYTYEINACPKPRYLSCKGEKYVHA